MPEPSRAKALARCKDRATVDLRLVPAAEQRQEEQEDVQDVEEDPGGQRHRLVLARPPKAVEVDDGVEAEDRQAGDAVDDVRGGDRDEEREQSEPDEREEGEEQ